MFADIGGHQNFLVTFANPHAVESYRGQCRASYRFTLQAGAWIQPLSTQSVRFQIFKYRVYSHLILDICTGELYNKDTVVEHLIKRRV